MHGKRPPRIGPNWGKRGNLHVGQKGESTHTLEGVSFLLTSLNLILSSQCSPPMLRGTGSLQEMLGRTMGRKRKRDAAPNDQLDQIVEEVVSQTCVDVDQDVITIKPTVAAESPLKSGNVRCPICLTQLPNEDGPLNSHLGTWGGLRHMHLLCDSHVYYAVYPHNHGDSTA
jgi:hypothetical protein